MTVTAVTARALASSFMASLDSGFVAASLRKVEKVVKALGLKSISLQVEEVNNSALGIYKKNGFEEIDRRTYIPFPGSHDTGDFILMMKNLK